MKAVLVTLKAALEERGLDTSGQKPVLVSRLLERLSRRRMRINKFIRKLS